MKPQRVQCETWDAELKSVPPGAVRMEAGAEVPAGFKKVLVHDTTPESTVGFYLVPAIELLPPQDRERARRSQERAAAHGHPWCPPGPKQPGKVPRSELPQAKDLGPGIVWGTEGHCLDLPRGEGSISLARAQAAQPLPTQAGDVPRLSIAPLSWGQGATLGKSGTFKYTSTGDGIGTLSSQVTLKYTPTAAERADGIAERRTALLWQGAWGQDREITIDLCPVAPAQPADRCGVRSAPSVDAPSGVYAIIEHHGGGEMEAFSLDVKHGGTRFSVVGRYVSVQLVAHAPPPGLPDEAVTINATLAHDKPASRALPRAGAAPVGEGSTARECARSLKDMRFWRGAEREEQAVTVDVGAVRRVLVAPPSDSPTQDGSHMNRLGSQVTLKHNPTAEELAAGIVERQTALLWQGPCDQEIRIDLCLVAPQWGTPSAPSAAPVGVYAIIVHHQGSGRVERRSLDVSPGGTRLSVVGRYVSVLLGAHPPLPGLPAEAVTINATLSAYDQPAKPAPQRLDRAEIALCKLRESHAARVTADACERARLFLATLEDLPLPEARQASELRHRLRSPGLAVLQEAVLLLGGVHPARQGQAALISDLMRLLKPCSVELQRPETWTTWIEPMEGGCYRACVRSPNGPKEIGVLPSREGAQQAIDAWRQDVAAGRPQILWPLEPEQKAPAA